MSIITVTGKGIAYAPVDTAEIRVTVFSSAQTGDRAVEETDRKLRALKEALSRKGFGEKELHTAQFHVRAEYEEQHGGGRYTRKLSGYRCEQTLKTEFPYSAERLSAAIAALSAGGELQIFFKAGSTEHALSSALEGAFGNAKYKAEALARASGNALGTLLRIVDSETASHSSVHMARSEAAMLCAAPAELNPEDECVSAVITAEWELL